MKSWIEKFETARPHEVKPVPKDIAGMKKGEIMLIPSPRIVDEFINDIPEGQAMDVKTLRRELANKYKAEVTCPITMGFHLRTVAEAALERREMGVGEGEITPVWRVLDETSPTLKKLSETNAALIRDLRQKENI